MPQDSAIEWLKEVEDRLEPVYYKMQAYVNLANAKA